MKKIVILIILFAGYQILGVNSSAQTPPQVILTWTASNFYPADYEGKPLATPNTPVAVSAEVLRNNRFIDVAKANFSWFLDEKLLLSGEGLKETNFNVGKTVGDSHFVRVKIESAGSFFENSIRIPVSKYGLVLKSPYPENAIAVGGAAVLEAIPYFFNISSLGDLIFSWTVGAGEKQINGGDNELVLNVPAVPAENPLTILGSANNRLRPIEAASERVRLTVY